MMAAWASRLGASQAFAEPARPAEFTHQICCPVSPMSAVLCEPDSSSSVETPPNTLLSRQRESAITPVVITEDLAMHRGSCFRPDVQCSVLFTTPCLCDHLNYMEQLQMHLHSKPSGCCISYRAYSKAAYLNQQRVACPKSFGRLLYVEASCPRLSAASCRAQSRSPVP